MVKPRSVSDLYLEALKLLSWGALSLAIYLLIDRYQAITAELSRINALSERIGRIETLLERSAR